MLSVKPPPMAIQQSLLPDLLPDKPLSRNGEARNRYGTAINTVVNALLGLEDIPNAGSHDVCFDSYHRPSSTYVEVKSLRRKGKLVVYDWRLEKDKAAGVPLVYVIGVHNCKGAASVGAMWHKMRDTLDEVWVFPHAFIEAEALKCEPRAIKTEATASGVRNGYQRPGYRRGYRNIPWSVIADAPMQGGRLAGARIYGLEFLANIFFHESLVPWL